LLEALVEQATRAGAIVVGAVSADPRFGFPGSISGVLPVAESEAAAVGDDILRAPARDIVTLVPDGHYDFASGSSLATAQISGVVALLLARNRKLGVARLRELLIQSTANHETTRGPFRSVNACLAVATLVPGARCAD
jgi:subtilisin family serine protease